MKKWEDIVRDRMEELDGTLPESAFAEFRARRNGAAAPAAKRPPLVWALIPAVAAGLAAVLLLCKPIAPDEGIQVITAPASPVAEVVIADSSEIAEPVPDKPIIARASTPKAVILPVVNAQVMETVENVGPEEETVVVNQVEEENIPVQSGTDITPSSPFVPQNLPAKPVVKMKVAPVAGAVAGGGLLAALVVPSLSGSGNNMEYDSLVLDPGSHTDNSVLPEGILTGTPTHSLPLKAGLSTRIPVSDRLGVTTGLEYSLYSSKFTYSLSGEMKQHAHYVGVPVRLDWTLASGKWLDVYVGGGVEGDFCVAADLDGNSLKKDGFSLSLIGAGGIQFNVTKRLGLYVEPGLSWTVPSDNRVLVTYRTEHPLMFSVSGGLRINVGK